MKVLVSESADKKTRQYIDIPRKVLLEAIKTDNGFHEVIDMADQDKALRLFFDIDWKSSEAPEVVLDNVLRQLNLYYFATNDDWAITNGSYNEVCSFHIYSKKHFTTLRQIRQDVKNIDCKYIDREVYYFTLDYPKDEGSLRLPNQSKASINKVAGVHRLIQGDLDDCIITWSMA
jgi:hypothetical protein